MVGPKGSGRSDRDIRELGRSRCPKGRGDLFTSQEPSEWLAANADVMV